MSTGGPDVGATLRKCEREGHENSTNVGNVSRPPGIAMRENAYPLHTGRCLMTEQSREVPSDAA